MAVRTGVSSTAVLEVTDADTAIAARSGDVPVLSSPRIIALMEQAAVAAIEGELPEGRTSVGVRVQVEHISPTAVGGTVTAEASLERVEGHRMMFNVTARDERGLVAAGKVTRVAVDRAEFLAKVR